MSDPRSAYHPIHARRIRDRSIQELLGIVRGILADSQVSDAESEGLARWLVAHPEAAATWPGSALYDRLARIYADGRLDEEERAELTTLLEDTVGAIDGDATGAQVTRLPLTEPPPTILFDSRTFVFTGTFFYGTRRRCETAVCELGGRVSDRVFGSTDFLVIGSIPTGAWQFSTHGRKIEKAVELRTEGEPIAIVSEEQWVTAMREATA
jgi:hypothetical protein